jgi:hypothetical protein
MVICIIASHIDHADRAKYLQVAIYSVQPYVMRIIVSCSVGDGFNAPQVTNCDLRVRNNHMLQFEHICKVITEENLDPNERIIFLDDDDLIFSAPPSYTTIGTQFLYQSHGCENFIDDKKIVYDFSGTICRAKDIKKYLKDREIKPIEDIDFMKFVKELPEYKEHTLPFVYHRLWDNPRTWVHMHNKSILDAIYGDNRNQTSYLSKCSPAGLAHTATLKTQMKRAYFTDFWNIIKGYW